MASISTFGGLDQLAAAVDVLIEPKSRKSLGGLPRSELRAHVLATLAHVGALALALAGRLRFVTDAAPAHAMHVKIIALGLVTGAAAVAALHVALLHPAGACCFAWGPRTTT